MVGSGERWEVVGWVLVVVVGIGIGASEWWVVCGVWGVVGVVGAAAVFHKEREKGLFLLSFFLEFDW